MGELFGMVKFLLRHTQGKPGFSPRILVGLVVLAGVLSGAASAGLLVLITRGVSNAENLTDGLIWAFLGLCVLMPLARFVSQVLVVHLTQLTMLDLRMELTRRILASPLRRLEGLGPSRLLVALTEDSATIREILTALPLLFMHVAVIVACLVYLAVLSLEMLAVVMVFLIVGVVTYRWAMNGSIPHFRTAREGADRLLALFRGLTDGTKELKLHAARRRTFHEHMVDSTLYIQKSHLKGQVIHAGANSWGMILSFVLIAVVFVMFRILDDISLETLTGTVLVILYMRSPVDVMLQMMPGISRANIAIERVGELGVQLDAPSSDAAIEVEEGLEPEWRSLQLRQVTHSYHREEEDREFVLGPIDLELQPGEILFIVGGNGSGKTTLAKMLLGLYPPEGGEIFVDGRRVGGGEKEWATYRERFSAVFSDFFLFDTLLGLDHDPELDRHAREYLAKLQIAHKVEVEDGVLSTLELSQGQRKRLALLTAYLEDRPIYLFDEWAADQDPYFKEIFYLELLPELRQRGKTVVVISHDDRYYHVADRIAKLEYGQLHYLGNTEGYLDSLGAPEGAVGAAAGAAAE